VKTKLGIAQRLPRGQYRGKHLAQTALKVTKTPSREEKKKIKTGKDSEPVLIIPCQYTEKNKNSKRAFVFGKTALSQFPIFYFLHVSVFLYMESN